MQRFASLAIFATAASAVDQTFTHTVTSPKMSVTAENTTASATISFTDTYTSKCTSAGEQVDRKAMLTVQVETDVAMESGSQMDVYHCGNDICHVWSWTQADGYMRESTVLAADYAIVDGDRPWRVFSNQDEGSNSSYMKWTIPSATTDALTVSNTCDSGDKFCNAVETTRAALNLVDAPRFSKSFTGKSTWTFAKTIAAGASDSLTSEASYPDLGDTWTAGVFYRQTEVQSDPNFGKNSAPITIDYKKGIESMNKKITDFTATKPAQCNPCSSSLLSGANCDVCSNGKDPVSVCVNDFPCANGTINYPVCRTCPEGRYGNMCKSCTNGNTGDACDVVATKDSAVSTVAMTSSAAVIAFGALAF